MNESFVMKISLVGSFIGLFVIYIIASYMIYPSVKIGYITGEMTGKTVNITGIVKNVHKDKNNYCFITVFDNTGEIKTVLWKNTLLKLNETIKNGDFLNIIGNVKLYKGEPEIIAKDVKFIKF